MSKISFKSIDYSQFHKGQHISVDEIEKLLCISRTSHRYASHVSNLCRFIQDRLTQRGEPCVCRIVNYGIQVYEDTEASAVLIRNFESRRLAMKRFQQEAEHNVNLSNLSAKDRAKHAARLAYMQKANESLALQQASSMEEIQAIDNSQSIRSALRKSKAQAQAQAQTVVEQN